MPTQQTAIEKSWEQYQQNGAGSDPQKAAVARGVTGNMPHIRTVTEQEQDLDSREKANNERLQALQNGSWRTDMEKSDPYVEKVMRNRRLISGIGDAISGFAGLISAANGSTVHRNDKTALDGIMTEDEKRRAERKAEIEKQYNMQLAANKIESTNIAEARKRLNELRQRPYKDEKQRLELSTAEYNNQYAQNRAAKSKTEADNAQRVIDADIARKNRSGLPKTATPKTPKSEQETTYHGGGRSFKIKASNQKQAISAGIAAINADDGFEARSKNAQDVFNEYLQSGRAKDNPAFWEAIAPYITDTTQSQKKGGLPGKANTSISTASNNTENDDPYGLRAL